MCLCVCVCVCYACRYVHWNNYANLLTGSGSTTLTAILPDICGRQNIARKQAVVTLFDGIGIVIGTPLVG